MQLGSIALFGMYLIVKFLGKEWINKILGWYFTFAGIGSVWKVSSCFPTTLLLLSYIFYLCDICSVLPLLLNGLMAKNAGRRLVDGSSVFPKGQKV